MSLDWNNTTDKNSYVYLEKEKKHTVTHLTVVPRDDGNSIFQLLFHDTERRKDAGENE